MAVQTLKDNPLQAPETSSPADFLENILETAEFLIDNPKDTKDGFSYQKVETFLKFLVINSGVETDFNPEKASLTEIVNFLRLHLDVFSKTEEHLESVVPTEVLQQLVQDLKEWEEGKNNFAKQRAAEKIAKISETFALIKKYQGIVEERLSLNIDPEKAVSVAKEITKELPPDPELTIAFEKAQNLAEPQKEMAEGKLAQQIQQTFEQTVSSAVFTLREQGLEISPDEEKVLKVKITNIDLPTVTSELSKPSDQRPIIHDWILKQITARFTPEEITRVTETLIPAVAVKIRPGSDPEQITEALIISIAETAPDLGTLAPEKISRIVSVFIPQDKNEAKLLSVSVIPAFSTSDEPIITTVLPSKYPRLTAPPPARSTPKDALDIKIKGKSATEKLRQRIFKEGVDKNNALQLQSMVLERWAIFLTAQNITPEDINYTIQKLLKIGEDPNSFRIRELRELNEAIKKFQANLPPLKVLEIKKQSENAGQKGELPVIINSRQQTVIFRESPFNPKLNLRTRMESFWSRLSGRKLIKLDSGPTIIISRFSFYKHQLSEGLKSILFRTGFGQNLSSWLKISTQRSLQGLWNLTQTGGKQLINEGLKPIGSLFTTIFKPISKTTLSVSSEGLSRISIGGNRQLSRLLDSSVNVINPARNFIATISNPNQIFAATDSGKNKSFMIVVFSIIFFTLIAITGAAGSFNDYGRTQETVSGCFVLSGQWTEEDKTLITGAINKILSHSKYATALCKNGQPINLVRVSSTPSGWCEANSSNIDLVDKCLGNEENTLYSLAHETGHIYSARNPEIYAAYLKQIGSPNLPLEEFLCSYPLDKSYGEDFPETFAVSITNYHYPNHYYRNCSKTINMQNDYPLHYNFVKDFI